MKTKRLIKKLREIDPEADVRITIQAPNDYGESSQFYESRIYDIVFDNGNTLLIGRSKRRAAALEEVE